MIRFSWLGWGGTVLLATAVLVGCSGPTGPKTVPVKGTLTVKGQPANNVTITFAPTDAKNPAASGQVINGAFELSSGGQGAKGAVPGKYKVVLAQQSTMTAEETAKQYSGGGGPPKAPELSFPAKYQQSATSDKEVEVKASDNDIKIDIP